MVDSLIRPFQNLLDKMAAAWPIGYVIVAAFAVLLLYVLKLYIQHLVHSWASNRDDYITLLRTHLDDSRAENIRWHERLIASGEGEVRELREALARTEDLLNASRGREAELVSENENLRDQFTDIEGLYIADGRRIADLETNLRTLQEDFEEYLENELVHAIHESLRRFVGNECEWEVGRMPIDEILRRNKNNIDRAYRSLMFRILSSMSGQRDCVFSMEKRQEYCEKLQSVVRGRQQYSNSWRNDLSKLVEEVWMTPKKYGIG